MSRLGGPQSSGCLPAGGHHLNARTPTRSIATEPPSQVHLVREMEVRYLPGRYPIAVQGRILSPVEAAKVASDATANTTVEEVLVLHLDVQRNLIGLHRVSQGTLDSASVHPREVFKVALLANAAAVIITHNHPGGDPTPSGADIEFTKRLIAAGELIGVGVLDHIVTGQDGAYTSIREAGLV